ncbi:hypothetical protein OSB04_020894 [Centaurea solstitialis]|uniref:Uncharacterized protein n=1 Tax=Centaurea solstitialis TaxID=347529 RepID=A0AA38T4I4_9ASTR|nr:hypothetical protein OSB04_020894 [Centaurea solstitialis]
MHIKLIRSGGFIKSGHSELKAKIWEKGVCGSDVSKLTYNTHQNYIDPRHRHGHNLHIHYDLWFESGSSQPFFYWLDVGDVKEINLEKCPRAHMQRQCIKYLGPKARFLANWFAFGNHRGFQMDLRSNHHEVLVHRQKKKGLFQHSSFLARGEPMFYSFILDPSKITKMTPQEVKNTYTSQFSIFLNLYTMVILEKLRDSPLFLAGGATTAVGRLVAHGGVLEVQVFNAFGFT